MNTVYAKFNRIRKPEFQTATLITEEHGEKRVQKKALDRSARVHIGRLREKYSLMEVAYAHIKPLAGEWADGEVCYPFLQGTTAKQMLEKYKNNVHELCRQMVFLYEQIFSIAESNLVSFSNTDRFEQIFGCRIEDSCMAAKVSDVDLIFENAMLCDGTWYDFDYEWVADFPIPVDFLRFRAFYRYYCSELAYFSGKMTVSEFMAEAGFDQQQYDLYHSMEGSFLCYIFGEDCRYSYPEKYSQGVIAIPQVMAENARLSSLEQENRSHIQEQSEEIGRLTMELAESGEQQSVLNIRLEELKNKAVEQEKQIEEQEKQKEELKNKVVEQENQIEEVQLLVIGLQADAGEAKKQIEQLETKEKELTKQKDETEQLLEKERLQMAELREELAVCESRNDAILNSKSWKITKPLRTIGGLLKK